MLESFSQGQLIHQTFSDINHFEEAHRRWHWGTLDSMQQLGKGPFQSDMTVLNLEGISIQKFFCNCLVNAVAAMPVDSFIFGILLKVQGNQPISNQVPINKNCIFGFNKQPEANLITSTEGLEMVFVIIKKSLFWDFAHQLRPYDLEDNFIAQNALILEPTQLIPYQRYLQQIIYLCEQQPQQLQNPVMPTLIRHDLIPLLINTLRDATKIKIPLPLRRAEIVRKAQEFIQANLHRPLTLKDIYQAVFASRRSLIYGFQDIFTMGPMSYLKIQRLNGIRRALLIADPKFNSVTDIANAWGFWHLGHFYHDYKKMFGETPLKTLKTIL